MFLVYDYFTLWSRVAFKGFYREFVHLQCGENRQTSNSRKPERGSDAIDDGMTQDFHGSREALIGREL